MGHFVLILDSNIDKHLLSGESGKHNLVQQIKSQGVEASDQIKNHIKSKYSVLDPVKILKHNNFILIEETKRTRVFMIE